MRIGARNVFTGKVSKIVQTAVDSEITIVLDNGGELIAVLNTDVAEDLGLGKGVEVRAVIKARDITLITQ